VLAEIGPVVLEVPRDRAGTFEPVIVPKRRRRLNGVDALVCWLSAKGLTHGEISAHLAEIYGAQVSKETVTRITDRVIEGMVEWENRPLDPVYPVIFIDALVVKIREGQVANRPIYVAVGVTVDGTRDILGLWAGDAGEGAKYWHHVLTEIRNRGTKDECIDVCDGLSGLPDAVSSVWPQAIVQTCVIHLLRREQFPLRRPPGLAVDRQGSQGHLHGAGLGAVRGVLHPMGGQVPGHRRAVGAGLGRVRALPQLRPGDPHSHLHHG
jgi:putative transposase